MADEKENPAGTEAQGAESQGLEAKVVLTKEINEMIEESVRKGMETLKEKQKAFRFHGSAASEREAVMAEKKADAALFIKSLATGDMAYAQQLHDQRAKALNVGNDATGGYLVPDIHETEILATYDSYSQIIADADVQMYNKPGNVFKLNELDTRVLVFASDENSTGLTGSTPSFSEPSIGITDWIGSTDITLDMLEDTEADLMTAINRMYTEQFAKALQARLINGDATVSGVVTKGIFNAANTNTVDIAATASGYTGLTFGDLRNAYYSAVSIASFQDSNSDGKFYMNALAYQAAEDNLIAGSSNYFLDPRGAATFKALGRDVVVTNLAPIPTTTTSNPFVVYGNLKRHLKIRIKRGMTMKVNENGTSASGRNMNYQPGRELVVTQRVGHQVVLPEGLTLIRT